MSDLGATPTGISGGTELEMGAEFHGLQLLQEQKVDSVFPFKFEYLLYKVPGAFVPRLGELKNKWTLCQPSFPKNLQYEIVNLAEKKISCVKYKVNV